MRMWFRIASFAVLFTCYLAYSWTMIGSSSSSSLTVAHESSRRLEGGACPSPTDPPLMVLLYIAGVLWLFIGLAIIADEMFVPALDVLSDKWDLSPDVAGATLMAAGGSSPELFTSAVGTFLRSSVGFGAIVGSAVFNILFVVGVCAMVTTKPMQLTWWPMFRDSASYVVVLLVLSYFFGVNTPQVIDWYEALILFLLYWVYVLIMGYNRRLHIFFGALFFPGFIIDKEEDDNIPLLNDPTLFREGIATLMVRNRAMSDTSGTKIVYELNNKVEAAFRKYDADGSGFIDAAELADVLHQLGLPSDEQSVNQVLTQMDTGGDGKLDMEEFGVWYIKAEQRLLAQAKAAFDQVDTDGSGSISADEVRAVMSLISDKEVSDKDVFEAISAIRGATDLEYYQQDVSIHYADFERWYLNSALMHHTETEAVVASEAAEGISIHPPSGDDRTISTLFWYAVTVPFMFAFYCTIPDVRQPGKQKFVYSAFIMCLVWMGVFSYYMVSWVETIGATLGIPSVIMGLTFLAAGTSVPDMLSAVIVAKQVQIAKFSS